MIKLYCILHLTYMCSDLPHKPKDTEGQQLKCKDKWLWLSCLISDGLTNSRKDSMNKCMKELYVY